MSARGMGAINELKKRLSAVEFSTLISVYKSLDMDATERISHLESVASLVDVNSETLKRQIREWLRNNPHVPVIALPNYKKELLRIDSDSVAYSGCWHAPTYVPSKMEAQWYDLKQKKIKDLVIVGDFGNWSWFDQHAPLKIANPHEESVDDFQRVSFDLLDTFLTVVERIFILTGNHESKVLRGGNGRFSWMNFLSDRALRRRVTLTPYPQAYVYSASSPTIKWTKAMHFSGYSRNPIALCEKALVGNVIPFEESNERYVAPNLMGSHTHGGWWGFNSNGVSRIGVLGTFADKDLASYTWTSTNGFPEWTTSWATFKDGRWSYETI